MAECIDLVQCIYTCVGMYLSAYTGFRGRLRLWHTGVGEKKKKLIMPCKHLFITAILKLNRNDGRMVGPLIDEAPEHFQSEGLFAKKQESGRKWSSCQSGTHTHAHTRTHTTYKSSKMLRTELPAA